MDRWVDGSIDGSMDRWMRIRVRVLAVLVSRLCCRVVPKVRLPFAVVAGGAGRGGAKGEDKEVERKRYTGRESYACRPSTSGTVSSFPGAVVISSTSWPAFGDNLHHMPSSAVHHPYRIPSSALFCMGPTRWCCPCRHLRRERMTSSWRWTSCCRRTRTRASCTRTRNWRGPRSSRPFRWGDDRARRNREERREQPCLQ